MQAGAGNSLRKRARLVGEKVRVELSDEHERRDADFGEAVGEVADERVLSPVGGELVALFAASLWYANAVRFQHELRAALAARSETSALVLDAIGMNDIDYTGARALRDLLDDLDRAQIAFALARPGNHLRQALARSGPLERIGTERLFPSVGEAVSAVAPEAGSNARP